MTGSNQTTNDERKEDKIIPLVSYCGTFFPPEVRKELLKKKKPKRIKCKICETTGGRMLKLDEYDGNEYICEDCADIVCRRFLKDGDEGNPPLKKDCDHSAGNGCEGC